MYSIQLKTAHGPAAFNFALSPRGRVSNVKCLMLDLPPAGLQLTFPDADPEELRKHLTAWEHVLPYLIEAGIWLETPPDYLLEVWKSFVAVHPGHEARRAHVFAINPTEEHPDYEHLRRVSAWYWMGVQDIVANFPDTRMKETGAFSADKLNLPARRLAVEWLTMTFPLAPPERIDDWLVAIGKTRTTEGNEFLFQQLERPGVLPYNRQIYSVLANSRLKLAVDRIIHLYEEQDKVRDALKAYIHLLGQQPFHDVQELLVRIITEHPTDSTGAVKKYARHDPEGIRELVVRLFHETTDYRTAMAMLEHSVLLAKKWGYFLDIRTINNRLADPALHNDAQVTWPQKLHKAWCHILTITPVGDVGSIMNEFLPEAKGAIARHLLLQLKECLLLNPDAELALSPIAEARLIDLLNSRYDKNSTVATDIVRLYFSQLTDPKQAVDALLEHILTSRYRMMDAAALARAAKVPGCDEYQEQFFRDRLENAVTEEEKTALRKIVGYLRHLPNWRVLNGTPST